MVNLISIIIVLIVILIFIYVKKPADENLVNRRLGYNFNMTDPEQIVAMEYQPDSSDWRMSDADILKTNGDTNYYGGENYHVCGQGHTNKYKFGASADFCGEIAPNRFEVNDGLGFDYATYIPGQVRRDWMYSPGYQAAFDKYKTKNNYLDMNPKEYNTPCMPLNKKYLADVAQQKLALEQKYNMLSRPPIEPFAGEKNISLGNHINPGDSYDRMDDMNFGGNKTENFSLNPSGMRLRERQLPKYGREVTSPNDKIGRKGTYKGYSYMNTNSNDNQNSNWDPRQYDRVDNANRRETFETKGKSSASQLSRDSQKGSFDTLFDNKDVINDMWTFNQSQQYDIPDNQTDALDNRIRISKGLDFDKFDADVGMAMRSRINADRARKNIAGNVRKTANYYKTWISDELRQNEAREWWGNNDVEDTMVPF